LTRDAPCASDFGEALPLVLGHEEQRTLRSMPALLHPNERSVEVCMAGSDPEGPGDLGRPITSRQPPSFRTIRPLQALELPNQPVNRDIEVRDAADRFVAKGLLAPSKLC